LNAEGLKGAMGEVDKTDHYRRSLLSGAENVPLDGLGRACRVWEERSLPDAVTLTKVPTKAVLE